MNLEKPPGGRPEQDKPVDLKLLEGVKPAGDALNLDARIKRVVEGGTDFGRFIKPMVDQLKALPEDRQTESLETFKIIWNFLKGKDLTTLEFELDDVLFMMGDRVGNLIRRPILNIQYADRLDKAVKAKGDKEQRVKDLVCKYFRGGGWSRFLTHELREVIETEYPGQIVMDPSKLYDEFRAEREKIPIFSLALVKAGARILQENIRRYMEPAGEIWAAEGEAARREGRESRFYTDPGHMFNAGTPLSTAVGNLEMQVKGTPWGLPPFAREVYFMLVEDNPFHFAWAESLEGCENLKRYIPPESMQSLDDVTRREESKGYYKSAERAFEVIEGSLNPPDVILADIELPGMDGIEFARKLYERETAAGRKPIIVAIYSSNVFPYEKELEKLKAEGIIVDAWHKSNFNIKQLIDTVNEKLKQRE